jgi:uncharacterized integral membrane protein
MSTTQPSENRRNPWTHVLVASCAVFIFTVFLMLAAAFNRNATALAHFFDSHGLLVLVIEVGVILGLAILVMAVERRQTLQRIEERERSLLESAAAAASDSTETPSQSPSGAESP